MSLSYLPCIEEKSNVSEARQISSFKHIVQATYKNELLKSKPQRQCGESLKCVTNHSWLILDHELLVGFMNKYEPQMTCNTLLKWEENKGKKMSALMVYDAFN